MSFGTIEFSFSADYAEFYGMLCNIVTRCVYDIPDDDPYSHTSGEGRTIANGVIDLLAELSARDVCAECRGKGA